MPIPKMENDMKSLRILSLECILITLFFVTHLPVSAQSTYGYAYYRVEAGSAKLVILYPTETTSPVVIHRSPRVGTTGNFVSPNGEWITSLALSTDHRNFVVNLYHFATGEVRQIAEGYVRTLQNSIVWSPDSQYLGLLFGQHPNSTDLWIYSMRDNALSNLTNDAANQHDLGWSPNSGQIVTLTGPCRYAEPCSGHLDMFDSATGSHLYQANLSLLPLLGIYACNPQFSPDSRFVSFVANCPISGNIAPYDFPNEVYLWDLASNTVDPITSYSYAGTRSIFAAEYHHNWLDEQTLLIGANYAAGEASEQQRLISYQVMDGTTTVLSRDIGARFSLNRPASRIALFPYQLLAKEIPITKRNAGQPTELSVGDLSVGSGQHQAANLVISDTTINIPMACTMQWSPDDRIVAVISSSIHCTLSVERIYFIDTENQSVQEYHVPSSFDEPDSYVIPVGWIRL